MVELVVDWLQENEHGPHGVEGKKIKRGGKGFPLENITSAHQAAARSLRRATPTLNHNDG